MKEKSVVIITGAAGGIGRATAVRFASAGYALALVDNDVKGLTTLKETLPGLADDQVLVLQGDLEDDAFLSAIVERTVERWGRIDVLINNAAWRTVETMRTISRDNWDKTIRINLTAPAFLAKYSATVMEEQNIFGVIINLSSVMSQRAAGYSPAYVVCKGAIESLTYELAVLYGPKGIRVVAVNPGNVETNLSADYTDEKGNNISRMIADQMNDHTPLKRSGRPEEIADILSWLVTKEASFITGTTIVADGGFCRNFNSYQIKKLQFGEQF